MEHVLDEPITVADGTFPVHIQNKMKNTDERPLNDSDGTSSVITSASASTGDANAPLFWKVPHSGGEVIEAIMAECFELVLASDSPKISDDIPITQSNPDEVRTRTQFVTETLLYKGQGNFLLFLRFFSHHA